MAEMAKMERDMYSSTSDEIMRSLSKWQFTWFAARENEIVYKLRLCSAYIKE